MKRVGGVAAPRQGEASPSVDAPMLAPQGIQDPRLDDGVLTCLRMALTRTVERASSDELLVNLPMAAEIDEECQTLVTECCRSAEQSISLATARAQRLAVERCCHTSMAFARSPRSRWRQ